VYAARVVVDPVLLTPVRAAGPFYTRVPSFLGIHPEHLLLLAAYPTLKDSVLICCGLHHELPWAHGDIPHPLDVIETPVHTLCYGIFHLVMSLILGS
jgi:hypothetical protein